MATPVAAGVAALVRDYFMQGFYPTGSRVTANSRTPSGALIKAVMINGAQPLKGIQNDDSSGLFTSSSEYDFNQGFGRIQLNNALPIQGNNDIKTFVADGVSLTQAQSEIYTFKVDTTSCSSNEMVVTLVWTDPATTGSWRCISNCVYNDLDLTVKKSSTGNSIIYSNGKNGRDSTDNVERVRTIVSNGEIITATVTARSIGYGTRQKFAFVATGCIGEEDNEVVVGTNTPTSSPTPSPTRSPTRSPTPSPTATIPDTPSPTPSTLTEVYVDSSFVLHGCSLGGFTAGDSTVIRKALNDIVTAVVSEAQVCNVVLTAATSSFDFNPPVAPPTDEGGRRMLSATNRVSVTFRISVPLETNTVGSSTATQLSQSIVNSLDVNIGNGNLETWKNIRAGSGLCTGSSSYILADQYTKPSYTPPNTVSSPAVSLQCSNWAYTPPTTAQPTPSPTPSPIPAVTSAPTVSPTPSPTKYVPPPTNPPTSSPTKAPTMPATPPPTLSPTTSAPTASECTNGFRDGTETDIDCGGLNCGACGEGKSCLTDSDCAGRGVCSSYVCTVPATPSPTVSPTPSPTPAATWRYTLLSFTIVFRVDGVTVNGFDVSDRKLLVRVLIRLLGYNNLSLEAGTTTRRNLGTRGIWPPPISSSNPCGIGESLLTVQMTDMYGDGWNGAELAIKEKTTSTEIGQSPLGPSFDQGSKATAIACVAPSTCYSVVVTGGSYPSEVGWSITNSASTQLLNGGAPFTGEFCSGTSAPTMAPTSTPTPTPHVDMEVEGVLTLEQFIERSESEVEYNKLKQRILNIVKTGKLAEELARESGWKAEWDVKEEEFGVPVEFEDDVIVYDEDPSGADDNDGIDGGDGGDGGFDVVGFLEDYGLYIGGGVGGLIVICALYCLVRKFCPGGGGQKANAHSKMYRGSAAPGAKRRSSAKQYGGSVNFGAAAGKATAKSGTKRYGAPPVSKNFQLV